MTKSNIIIQHKYASERKSEKPKQTANSDSKLPIDLSFRISISKEDKDNH